MPTKIPPAESWLFSRAEMARIDIESELIQARAQWDYHLVAYGADHHQTKHDLLVVRSLEKQRRKLTRHGENK